MTMDPKRVAVISGRHPATRFESPLNHRAYCARHGYTSIHCPWPTLAANAYFNKIEYLRHHAAAFDWVFWIDDDAFFLDLDRSLDTIAPAEGQFLSICASPDNKDIHTFVSSGQFLLRCDEVGLAFLDAVATADLAQVKAWWTDDLGYFTNGDQDAMVHLLLTDPRFAAFSRHDHRAFNSRPAELANGIGDAFVVHFTGPPPTKHRDHAELCRRLGLPPSLLPTAVDRQYVRRVRLPRLRAAVARLVRRVRER